MASASRGGGGRGGSTRGKGYVSVGAAAGSGKPNGAILEDNFEVKLGSSDNFRSWAKRYRQQKLKAKDESNQWFKMQSK